MIEPDLLAKALDYQESQITVLELELTIAKDRGTSPEEIGQIETTITSLKENETALIPLLDLSNASDGDWGHLELSNVVPSLIVESGFYGEGEFRKGRVLFAGWGVESGGPRSIIGGATVSFDEKTLLIVRRAFDPDELRSAIIAERARKQRTAGFPNWITEERNERGSAALNHSDNWLFFKRWYRSAVLVRFVSIGQTCRIAALAARKYHTDLFVGFIALVAAISLFWRSGEVSHPPELEPAPSSIWSDEVSQLSKQELIATVETAVVRLDVVTQSKSWVGSGFVLDDSGIVVTNHHVVDGATSAKALFADDTSVRVIGVLATDTKRDIAFVQIQQPKAKRLTSLKLRKALPEKGQAVISFGAPKSLSFTISEGIISGPLRSTEELSELIGDLTDFSKSRRGKWIQTTAPISHGNSGGPLVDLSGRVVGMNTWHVPEGQNLNFAISAADIADVFEDARVAKPKPFPGPPQPTAPSATALPVAQLTGNWQSTTTGDIWLLRPHFDDLTIDVVASRSIKQAKGKLRRNGDAWSGFISAIFVEDNSQRERESDLKMVVVNHDEIELIADSVKWNRKGEEVSRQPISMRLIRKK